MPVGSQMLENPKAATTIEVKTSPDGTMDNQQTTAAIIAGLYMGEGHFTLRRQRHAGSGETMHIDVGFSNTDPALVDFVCKWLDENQISHFIAMNNSTCYQVKVGRHTHVLCLLDLIQPFMIGTKLAEIHLLRTFIQRRLLRRGGNEARRYDEIDRQIAEEKDQLRELSETKRSPHCWDVHRQVSMPRGEDIVHA